METRKIGRLEVSVVGLGCNNFGRRVDAGRATEVVEAALEEGVTFFDTADVYGEGLSEEYLGRALGDRRDEVVIATKFGGKMAEGSGAGASWVRRAAEDSLRRLGTDHIDLYQIHMPDEETPVTETLEALHDLQEAGLVKEVGCSNFSVDQLEEGVVAGRPDGRAGLASVQDHYSLLHREPEGGLLEACRRHGLAFIPYFPLASGLLTGKYREGAPEGSRLGSLPPDRAGRFLNPGNLEVVERLESFCRERERSLLELAVSWLLHREEVASVIAGATRPEQVRANAGAAGWALSPEELAAVDRLAG